MIHRISLLIWAFSALGLLIACSPEPPRESPPKSLWSGNFNNGQDPGTNPGQPQKSTLDISFLSSNLERPTNIEVSTNAFPAIRETQATVYDYFYLQSTLGTVIPNAPALDVQVTTTKGAFASGPVSTDLGNLIDFSYTIWAPRKDGGIPDQVSSSLSDSRLEFASIEFWEYGPDKIDGVFKIKTWSDNGNGFSEQYHWIEFTLYPDENNKLFD